jgi:hypothetical protein
MLDVGQVVKYTHRMADVWVVVSVNECRASLVPIGKRSIEDTTAVYYDNEKGIGLSPQSTLMTVGYVRGSIKRVDSAILKPTKAIVPEAPTKIKIRTGSLPDAPMDDILSDLNVATGRLFSGGLTH